MIKALDEDPGELNSIPGPATDLLCDLGLNLFVPLFPICRRWINTTDSLVCETASSAGKGPCIATRTDKIGYNEGEISVAPPAALPLQTHSGSDELGHFTGQCHHHPHRSHAYMRGT